MKRARKCIPIVLRVLFGILCLLGSAPHSFAANIQGRWRWVDARDSEPYEAFPALFESISRDFSVNFNAAQVFSPRALDGVRAETNEFVETIYRGGALSTLAIAPYGKRVFAYSNGAWGTQDAQNSDDDKPGFSIGSWGGGVGKDWNLFGHGIAGFGLQGNETKIKPRDGGVYKTSINTFAGYLHLSVFDALWRVDARLGMARNRQKQRLLESGALNSFSTTQWLLDLEFGARFDKGYTRVEPFVNFRILNLDEPKKAEKYLTSSTYASEFSDASYRLKLGSRFSWERETALATLKPYLLVAWARELGKREIYTIGDNSPFPVAARFGTHRMAPDRLDLGGGVAAAMRETLDLYFQYDVEFAKEYVDYLFFAGLNKKF